MKNQYFGDKPDYVKYGLLRCLGNGGETSIAVCWMLTPGDGSRQGNRLAARPRISCRPPAWGGAGS